MSNEQGARAWPIGLAVALGVFVIVQVAFAIVAVTHGDPVVDSYRTEAR